MELDPSLRSVCSVPKENKLREALIEDATDWKLAVFDSTSTHTPQVEREVRRLRALQKAGILDTPTNEPEFDEITRTAREIFDVPLAIVTMVDLGRQWFKSINGMDGVTETPRCISFCSHVVNSKHTDEVFVSLDTSKDFRFQDNPLVAESPKIRFYAGAPIVSPDKEILGSVCILDFAPREGFSRVEKARLIQMASEAAFYIITRTD